jgi:predicted Zn finger-like uncharacterized protein
MILTCPACSKRYQVDESKFPPAGRTVRCAKCGHQWFQMPPDPGPDPGIFVEEPQPAPEPPQPQPVTEPPPEPVYREPAPEPEPELPPRPAAFTREPADFQRSYAPARGPEGVGKPPRPPSHVMAKLGLGLGWLGLVGLVLAIGWSALQYRQKVMAHWPQSASLYSTLGLKPAAGFQVTADNYRKTVEDGQPVLVVTGHLINQGDAEIRAPKILAVLSDENRRELYHWTFSPGVLTLKPGQSTRFVTRLSSPPAAARHLDLRIAKAGE